MLAVQEMGGEEGEVWEEGILLNDFLPIKVLLGYRLEKPKSCTEEIYHIMYSTWQEVSYRQHTLHATPYDANHIIILL